MAEVKKSVGEEEQEKLSSIQSGEAVVPDRRSEEKESEEDSKSQDSLEKGTELPETIRPDHGKPLPGLPPIDINELTSVLRSPNMPSQKIMKEVADKMKIKSEESESDDGSVGSTGVVGMKGLFDCIMEVSLFHPDSDVSDDDCEDEIIPREIPCRFCTKIFGSTMTWKTHVLVAHPEEDPSVLNIKRPINFVRVDQDNNSKIQSTERREKGYPAHRKRSKGSLKSDCDIKESKVRHPSNSDCKVVSEFPPGEENIPVGKKQSSFPRSHQRAASISKPEQSSQQGPEQLTHESVRSEKGNNTPATSVSTGKDVRVGEGEEAAVSSAVISSEGKDCQPSQENKLGKSKIESDTEGAGLSASSVPPPDGTKAGDCGPSPKKRRTSSASTKVSSSSSLPLSSDLAVHSKGDSTDKASSSASKRKISNTPSEDTKKPRQSAPKEMQEKKKATPTRRSTRRR